MSDTKFGVAVFPFLKTSKPVAVGRYIFRCTTDLEGLPSHKAAAVTEIASMLYLRDDIRITHAAYAIAEPLDSFRPGPTVEKLEKVRSVIGYFYSAPDPTSGDIFLPFENATLAVLEPGKISLYLIRPDRRTMAADEVSSLSQDRHGRLQGYEGVLNLRQPLWLAAGSRLYGPKPNMMLSFSQDFAVQFPMIATSERPDLRLLMGLIDKPASPFNERIFIELDWYNGANMDNADPNKSLLDLAVAFETLLQLPAGEKTDRLVDAISLLLGRTDRLADWDTQFYAARSQVAHEGRVRDWRFYTQRTKKKEDLPHSAGSVMNFGRQIF